MTDYSEIAMPTADTLHSAEATGFLTTVYAWMFAGLALTSAVAWYVASTPSILYAIASSRGIVIGLFLLTLAMVIVLSAAIKHLSAGVATALFLVYSALNGVTFSFVLIAYAHESVVMAFLSAACLFGTMSLYGYATKRDLTAMGSLLLVGLIALVVCSVINIFVGSSGFEFALSLVGIVVFLGLTAYDTQKILRFGAAAHAAAPGMRRKAAILGALTLYLDFVNLFLYMLRLFGRRK